jgi:hypothetical protein
VTDYFCVAGSERNYSVHVLLDANIWVREVCSTIPMGLGPWLSIYNIHKKKPSDLLCYILDLPLSFGVYIDAVMDGKHINYIIHGYPVSGTPRYRFSVPAEKYLLSLLKSPLCA